MSDLTPQDSPIAVAATQRVCPSCGTRYDSSARFCPVDRAPLQIEGAPTDDPLIASLVADRFYIERKLGEGGMGRVYLASQLPMNRACSLKVMRADALKLPDARARFTREALSVSRMSHANIVSVYDSGETVDGVPHIPTEFIDGESLSAARRLLRAPFPAAHTDRLRLTDPPRKVRFVARPFSLGHSLASDHVPEPIRQAMPLFDHSAKCTRRYVAVVRSLLPVGVIALGVALPTDAQVARTTIPVDLGSGVIAQTLPFQVPFFLSAPASAPLREVRLWVGSKIGGEKATWQRECRALTPPADTARGRGRTDVDPKRSAGWRILDALTRKVDSVKPRVSIAQAELKSLQERWERSTSKSRADTLRAALARAQEERANSLSPAEQLSADSAVTKAQNAMKEAAATIQEDAILSDSVVSARQRLDSVQRQLVLATRTRDAFRVTSEPTSVWSRNTTDSATSLILEVGALRANRDYTFCFHLVRAPSKEDSAAFVKRAIASVGRVVETFPKIKVETAAMLDSIQAALVEALPAADSLVLRNNATLFSLLQDGAQEESTQKRDRRNRMAALFAQFSSALFDVANRIQTADRRVDTASKAIVAVMANGAALRELGRIGEDTLRRASTDSVLWHGAALARRMALFQQSGRTHSYPLAVAEGGVAIDDVTARVPGRTMSGKPLPYVAAHQTRLERSLQLLDGLVELAEYVRLHPKLLDHAVSVGQIDLLIRDAARAVELLDGELKAVAAVAQARSAVDEGVQNIVSDVTTMDFAYVGLRATTSTTYKVRASMHISLDAGVFVARGLREAVPYLGLNWYPRPVNKEAPLSTCNDPWGCLSRRFAFTIGVSATSVKQPNRVEDYVNGRAVFLGAGSRVTDYLRFTGGTVIVKTFVNGVSERPRPHALPAFAATLDIDVISLLGKVGSALIPNL